MYTICFKEKLMIKSILIGQNITRPSPEDSCFDARTAGKVTFEQVGRSGQHGNLRVGRRKEQEGRRQGGRGDNKGRRHLTVGSLGNRLRGVSREGTVIGMNGAGVESEGGVRAQRGKVEQREQMERADGSLITITMRGRGTKVP